MANQEKLTLVGLAPFMTPKNDTVRANCFYGIKSKNAATLGCTANFIDTNSMVIYHMITLGNKPARINKKRNLSNATYNNGKRPHGTGK